MKLCIYTLKFTDSLEQSSFADANWFSASQEVPCILWNLKVHYRIHKCPQKYLELTGNESFWILLNREQYKLHKSWVTQQVLLKFWLRKSIGK